MGIDMNDVKEMKEMKEMNIALVGSFDPPHLGHSEMIQLVLQEYPKSKVWLIPNNPRKSKPDRSPLETRLQMLQIFAQEIFPIGRVTVTDKPIEELLHLNFVGLMGSDAYGICVKKNRCKVPIKEWIIVERYNVGHLHYGELITPLLTILKTLHQQKVICSTSIRKYFWTENLHQILVSPHIRSFISNNYMYHPFRHQYSTFDLPKIKGQKSFVFYVAYNQLCIKVFRSKDEEEVERINHFSISCSQNNPFKLPQFSSIPTLYPSIIMEKINGPTLNEYLANSSISMTEKVSIMSSIGKSLKVWHLNNIKQGVTTCHEKFNGKIDPEDVKVLKSFNDIVVLLHGDFSCNNVMIELNTSKIALIDFEKVNVGFPSYEYWQFISSIETYVNLSSDEKRPLIQGFKDGYGLSMNINLVNRIMENYWIQKRTLLVDE